MAQLPLPPQLSTDPLVNASAMAWAAQLVDQLQLILNGSVTSGVNADKLDSIDSLGFLKLLTVGDHKVAFGYSGTKTTDGAGHATVNHGLGVTPSCTLTMSDTGVSTRPVVTTSHTSTVVDAFFNAAGVSIAFWWLTIS